MPDTDSYGNSNGGGCTGGAWMIRSGALRALLAVAVLTASCALSSGCSASSSSSPSPATSSPAPDSAEFTTAMGPSIAKWRASFQNGPMAFTVPGTVVAASLGSGAAGVAADGDGVPATQPLRPGETFHIGSMTKLFTAALIMQLDQEHTLRLDQTIDTWFPDAPNGHAITVQMLLEHESGLYELDFSLVGVASTDDVIANVFAQTPIAAPGTQYQYLNAGYILLGRIAELAAGRSYGDLVEARFLRPLGLSDTYLDGHGTGAAAVTGYDLTCAEGGECLGTSSTLQPVDSSPQWTGAWSAGGMVSSARDQTVWIRALVAGDVLDAEHRELMSRLTPLSSAYYADAYGKAKLTPVQLGEGAGLASWQIPGVGLCLGHAGAIPGANGVTAYCPETRLAITILSDSNPAGTSPGYPGLVELAPAALRALGGKQP